MTQHAPNGPSTLVVAVSARALFDTSEDDAVFRTEGLAAFTARQRALEDTPMPPGGAMPLVRALLELEHKGDGERPVEVVIVSGQHPDTGVRAMQSARHHGLAIERAVFTGGECPVAYLQAFGASLFLTRSPDDAQAAVDAGTAAAVMGDMPQGWEPRDSILRIAFDGDGVLFDDSSEAINFQHGLAAFSKNEIENVMVAMGQGPFFKLASAIARLRAEHPDRVRIALVTARGAPSHERALRTLREWGLEVDTAAFLGGRAKKPFLEAFGCLLFVDDSQRHVDLASTSVPSGRVPWPRHGAMAVAMAAASKKGQLPGRRRRLRAVPEESVTQPEGGSEGSAALAPVNGVPALVVAPAA